MTREEIISWLEHLANKERVPECREALEIVSWVIYGCPEDVVESYSVLASKCALCSTGVLLAEQALGKSIEEAKRRKVIKNERTNKKTD